MFQYWKEENVHFVLTFELHSLKEATPVTALTHYNHSWEHACGGTAAVGTAHFSTARRQKALQKVAFRRVVLLLWVNMACQVHFHWQIWDSWVSLWQIRQKHWHFLVNFEILGCMAFHNFQKHPKYTLCLFYCTLFPPADFNYNTKCVTCVGNVLLPTSGVVITSSSHSNALLMEREAIHWQPRYL